jgi:hypothetical protein
VNAAEKAIAGFFVSSESATRSPSASARLAIFSLRSALIAHPEEVGKALGLDVLTRDELTFMVEENLPGPVFAVAVVQKEEPE